MHEHHLTGPLPGGQGASPPPTDHVLPSGQPNAASTTGIRLTVEYFDAHTAHAHRAQMWIEDGMLQLAGRDVIRQVPLSKVQWPEPTRHGFRLANIADGSAIQALDVNDWDAWLRQHALEAPPLAPRARPQSWRWAAVAACLLLILTVMGCWRGLVGRPLSPFSQTLTRPATIVPLSASAKSARATSHALPRSA